MQAFAKLDFEDHAFPEFVTSARALALGNAYLSKVDDSWSAFYNPAGLGSVRKFQFHLFNLHAEASNGFIQSSTDGEYTINDKFDPTVNRASLVEHQGKLSHGRVNAFPNMTFRGLTLGYMYSHRLRSIINDDVANTYEIAERKDHGPVAAFNLALFGGIIKFGVSGVYLYRREIYKSFDPDETVSVEGSDYREGRSLQVTGGTRLTLPITFLPTFSAVLRNATQNDFEGASDYGAPTEIQQTIDYGFSLTPQFGKKFRIHMEANFKDANNAYESNPKRRLAAGIELDFNRRIFIRGGYGDGWGSGGIGIRSRKIILDLSSYAVDQSRAGFREKEDRRFVFSLSSGF